MASSRSGSYEERLGPLGDLMRERIEEDGWGAMEDMVLLTTDWESAKAANTVGEPCHGVRGKKLFDLWLSINDLVHDEHQGHYLAQVMPDGTVRTREAITTRDGNHLPELAAAMAQSIFETGPLLDQDPEIFFRLVRDFGGRWTDTGTGRRSR